MNIIQKVIISSLLLFQSYAISFDLSHEVTELNKTYGDALEYPIVVFDKHELSPLLKGLGESQQAEVIKRYTLDKHQIELTRNEAINLVPYFTTLNRSASALPFFKEGWSNEIKFCAVLPNGETNTLSNEVKRVLGHSDEVDVYGNFDFSKIEKLFTLEELYLYSLYHELSHCLDKNFMPSNYRSMPSGHGVHEAEAFAEVNALFLLAQKKGMRRLGTKRALLRKTYSQFMGPYLASDKVADYAGELVKQGGGIYFLTPAIIAAQRELNNYRKGVIKYSLEETLKLSKEVVEHHAIDGRSFHALIRFFKNGRSEALSYYRELAEKEPGLFLATYYDLVYLTSILDN